MSKEEAINKARGILSRGGDGGVEDGGGGSQGSRGMGTRDGGGRGQRGGRGGRGSGRGRGMSYRDDDDDEEDTKADKANAEKLEKHLGLKKMDLLVPAFEEACTNVLTRDGGGRGQRGGRGGRGSGRGRGRGRGRGVSYRDDDDDGEDMETDKANAEKLEKHLGLKNMDLLLQAFEEACSNVLPSPEEDAHVDAMHTNLLVLTFS